MTNELRVIDQRDVLGEGLIPVTLNESHEPIVSGRMLHEFLEVETPYKKWFDRMIEYGFSENTDFVRLDKNVQMPNGGVKDVADHAIKLDMAKELSMIQRNEKGKQARQYFIQIENDWNSPDKIMARALLMADRTISQLKLETTQQKQLIAEQQPLVDFTKTVLKSKDNILVRQLSKIAQDEGIMDIGEKKLYNKLRQWGMILSSSTEPSQRFMNSGLFVVEEKTKDTSYGVKLIKTTKVTPKGQVYIIEKLRKEMVS